MAQSELVYLQGSGFYSTDMERWSRFLEAPAPLLVWVEWPRVFAALSEIAEFLAESAEAHFSDYLTRSRSVTLNDRVRVMLSNSGLLNPFLKPCGLDGFVEANADRVGELIAAPNANGHEAEIS